MSTYYVLVIAGSHVAWSHQILPVARWGKWLVPFSGAETKAQSGERWSWSLSVNMLGLSLCSCPLSAPWRKRGRLGDSQVWKSPRWAGGSPGFGIPALHWALSVWLRVGHLIRSAHSSLAGSVPDTGSREIKKKTKPFLTWLAHSVAGEPGLLVWHSMIKVI